MVTSVRISGVNLPIEKKVYVSLSYLFGIGYVTAKQICKAVDVDYEKRMKDLSTEDIEKIRLYIDRNFVVEGDLRGRIAQDIKSKIAIGCYEGNRHRNGLPVRGQRTKTNARTRKGKRKEAVPMKKKV